MSDLDEQIAALELELEEWTAGGRSHWNDVHGSVTGDYAGQWKASADADAAEVSLISAKLAALRARRDDLPGSLRAIANELRAANLIAWAQFNVAYDDGSSIGAVREAAIAAFNEAAALIGINPEVVSS